MQLTAVEILKLLVKDILAAAKGKLAIPCPVRVKKSTLVDYVVANLTPALEDGLHELLARQPRPPVMATAMDRKQK